MSHFLFCIRHPQVERRLQAGDTALDYCASNQLRKMAVGRGDTLWVVDCPAKAQLRLLGRIHVGRVVSQEEARRVLARRSLYPRDWVAIAVDDSQDHIIPLMMSSQAPLLRFRSGVDRLPPSFTGQHLQSLRRLKPETVALLEDIWYTRHA